MNTNIDNFIKKIVPFLVVILLAYILTVSLGFFLPNKGINYISDNVSLKQTNYVSLFSQEKTVAKVKKDIKTNIPNTTLKEFKLNAIYYLSDNGGWIVLVKRNGETLILEKGEEVNGYKLISLFKNHVIFEKNNKEFKIVLDETVNELEPVIEEIETKSTQDIKKKDGLVSVNRNYLNSYVSNIDKIWKDIAIKEIRKNRKIDGFEILTIKAGSDFEKLGLKKGDIIKSVNSIELKSYADAFQIYNNIKDINYLNIEILRNNNTMELNYEIN